MVTVEIVNKCKMKSGKAPGPSGIIAEMMIVGGVECIRLLILTEAIFTHGTVPKDWEESYILDLYKGKGEALDNYRGLKLTDQVMKVVEHMLEVKIQEMVSIDEIQALCLLKELLMLYYCQVTARKIAARKPLYFAFIDLEKAFDRVPRKVLWC